METILRKSADRDKRITKGRRNAKLTVAMNQRNGSDFSKAENFRLTLKLYFLKNWLLRNRRFMLNEMT